MKWSVQIIGRDMNWTPSNGVVAVLRMEGKVDWLPTEKRDVGKTDGFMPTELYELMLTDETGRSVRFAWRGGTAGTAAGEEEGGGQVMDKPVLDIVRQTEIRVRADIADMVRGLAGLFDGGGQNGIESLLLAIAALIEQEGNS